MNSITRIKRSYYLIVFLNWFAVAVPLALMILLIQARGFDLFEIGLAMGIYSLTIVVFELPTGGLADAIGRKTVALWAHVFNLLSVAGILFAFSYPMLLFGMVCLGIGRALSSGALDAWFVDSLQAADPEVDLQAALAHVGTVTLAALGLGTLLGGFMPGWFPNLPADGTAVITPLATTILLSLFVRICLIVVIVWLVDEERPVGSTHNWRKGFQQMPVIVRDAVELSGRNPILLLLMAITALSSLVLGSLETFWQPHFADLLGSVEGNSYVFGVIMAGNFLVGMVGNFLSIPLSKLLKQRYALLAGLFWGMQLIVLFLLAAQTAVVPAVIFFWLTYFVFGVVGSPHGALLNHEIPAERRSSMLSVQSLAGYAGGFLGGAFFGYLAESRSVPAVWIVAGGLSMVSLLLYLMIDRRQRTQARINEQAAVFLEDAQETDIGGASR